MATRRRSLLDDFRAKRRSGGFGGGGGGGGGGMNYGENGKRRKEEADNEEEVLRNRRLWRFFKMARQSTFTLTVYLEITDATDRPTDRSTDRAIAAPQESRGGGRLDVFADFEQDRAPFRLATAAAAADASLRFTKHLCRK